MKKDIPRIIGTYSSGKKEALLFVTAGIHGNEPSGIIALQNVFDELSKSKPEMKGTLVGVSGNKKALNKGVRFIDEDLNRTWTQKNIKEQVTDTHEKKEMFEIIKVLKEYPASEFNKRYFLDCHTTSSDSLPYASVQDVHDNDRWAHRFPTYIIRGFSDIVDGTTDGYMSRQGLTGFVLEAGQHDDPNSVIYHEGTIWIALQEACGLDLETLSTFPKSVTFLQKQKAYQKTFEIEYRHGLDDDDTFKMEPGYKNFQPIEKGELLAHQNGNPVKSDWDAYIFMPLYQKQGNDGFFVVKEV
ncbi:M14 family metallopeptidase [Marixanthomonas spongiae]|uniref:succinylglutamate desuccinylase/aspartoacylase domain-containing protein n=1 Tax=Marixanthomonas spongiae TaxID=2174845 RepID=UPI001F0CD650|nr:succinylglutamate desuccinylase/aspartoacylase family protein [Marixanthomonas spongiae]